MKVIMKCVYGHCRIVETMRMQDGKLLLGGYAIHYDEDGREVRRTPDQINIVVTLGT